MEGEGKKGKRLGNHSFIEVYAPALDTDFSKNPSLWTHHFAVSYTSEFQTVTSIADLTVEFSFCKIAIYRLFSVCFWYTQF